LRFYFIFLGIVTLLWLPVEEHSLLPVLLVSGCACILGALAVIDKQQSRQSAEGTRKRNLWYPLTGMLAGAALSLIALVLIAVKTGVHGHGISDYSLAQVSTLLRLTPLWICLGFIAGGVVAAWRR
jgi:hypothetical protein